MQLIEIRKIEYISENIKFKSPADIAKYCMNKPLNMQTLAQEHLYCFCLDAQNTANTIELISKGSLTSATVHPREVFKAAILSNSASIVLVHNHPSGNTNPSTADIAITRQINNACDILGITLYDHIIIGNGDYFSFNKAGLL